MISNFIRKAEDDMRYFIALCISSYSIATATICMVYKSYGII